MIKKWIGKVLPSRNAPSHNDKVQAACLTRNQHPLRTQHIGLPANKIIQKLHENGFVGYVVGGAVRDLLLQRTPKDFDIATNAKPEEVRQIFRRSRIIGRRFQIVHVMSGRETLEVTTFRGGNAQIQNEHGRIMHDNVFGTQEEDALRRDFTCNALYFDPIHEVLMDYHGGLQDIAQRKLVMIGNADTRFQEDPMRILRAVRLSAKLHLSVDEPIQEAIVRHAHLLKKEPIARLFDEIMKELLCGSALDCMRQLRTLQIPTDTHPLFSVLEEGSPAQQLAKMALAQTDERVREDKPVAIGFILAALLWGKVADAWQNNLAEGMSRAQALQTAISEIKESTEKGWGVPHRFSATMREIWQLQSQFDQRRGHRPFKLLHQPRFRAAYDFLLLRAACGEVSQELPDWWQHFQAADNEQQNQLIQQANPTRTNTRKRKPRKKKNTEETT